MLIAARVVACLGAIALITVPASSLSFLPALVPRQVELEPCTGESSVVCCADGFSYCELSTYCVIGTNGVYGCCPTGQVCSGAGTIVTVTLTTSEAQTATSVLIATDTARSTTVASGVTSLATRTPEASTRAAAESISTTQPSGSETTAADTTSSTRTSGGSNSLSPASEADASSPPARSLSTGAKAGIGVGAAVGALIIGLVAYFLGKRRRSGGADVRPPGNTGAAQVVGAGNMGGAGQGYVGWAPQPFYGGGVMHEMEGGKTPLEIGGRPVVHPVR